MAVKQKERYQATLDDYYSFMEEFPKSQYSKEVNNIFQKTNKYLKTGIPDTRSKIINIIIIWITENQQHQ